MAAIVLKKRIHDNLLRKNRVFRDRRHPLEVFNDEEVFRKFRFHRKEILAITDEIHKEISRTQNYSKAQQPKE